MNFIFRWGMSNAFSLSLILLIVGPVIFGWALQPRRPYFIVGAIILTLSGLWLAVENNNILEKRANKVVRDQDGKEVGILVKLSAMPDGFIDIYNAEMDANLTYNQNDGYLVAEEISYLYFESKNCQGDPYVLSDNPKFVFKYGNSIYKTKQELGKSVVLWSDMAYEPSNNSFVIRNFDENKTMKKNNPIRAIKIIPPVFRPPFRY